MGLHETIYFHDSRLKGINIHWIFAVTHCFQNANHESLTKTLFEFLVYIYFLVHTTLNRMDPRVYSSGKFTATTNRITKRGSSRLRHALYLAVLCGIRSSRNKKLKEFYDKKKSEGKPAKVAIVACINKLLHWIYALLNRKKSFLDIA